MFIITLFKSKRLSISFSSNKLIISESPLRSVLKSAGFIKRDARRVERKKYGRPKARRSFQFSKR